jgi:hypothetical protein
MESPPLAAVARVAVDDFRRCHEATITPALAAELAVIVEVALLTAVREERRACAAECTRRALLWERTGERIETVEPLRRDAEARANEALVLADAITSRT